MSTRPLTKLMSASLGALLALGSATAQAAEKVTLREQIPATADEPARPKVIEGDIVEVQATALRVRTGAGDLVLVGFDTIAPECLYQLLLARVDAKDVDARLKLVDTLQRATAFDAARTELAALEALAPDRADTLAQRRRVLDDVHAQSLYNRGLELMLERQWTAALDVFRTVADRFAETRWAPKAIERSERAVAGLEAEDGATASTPDRPSTPADKAAERKAKLIAHCQAEATKNIASADESNREGLKLDGEGKVSAAKKAYEEALLADTRAKNFLGRRSGLQRIATDLAVLEDAQKKIEQINKHMVLVHLNIASLVMKERNFKRARTHVTEALKIDPMNKRALELKAEIDKHSISRKVSDLTNARPTVTGGGR